MSGTGWLVRGRRLGGELGVIVFGVIIALWADGLAEDRRARADLDVHLAAVQDELRTVSRALADYAEEKESQLEALDWLAALPERDEWVDQEIYEAVSVGLLSPTTFEPELGALRDLESAGLLPLTESLDLRTEFSALRDQLGFMATTEMVNITGPAQRLFDPWVLDELPFVWRGLARVGGWSGGPDDPLAGADWTPLTTERGQAVLAMRYDLTASTLVAWRDVQERLTRTIELIDQELSGS